MNQNDNDTLLYLLDQLRRQIDGAQQNRDFGQIDTARDILTQVQKRVNRSKLTDRPLTVTLPKNGKK